MQSGHWLMIQVSSFTLKDLLTKYKNEITPSKRRYEVENIKLRRLLREKDLMSMPI